MIITVKRVLLTILVMLLLIAACSKNKTLQTTEQKLDRADTLFSQKKYAKAALLYEEVSFERKSASTARALLRQAESYFQLNKFIDARLKYSQFTQMFPDHPEASTAFFKIAVCFYEESLPPQYDQGETELSINAFKVFIDKFPNDERFSNALEYIRKAQYKLLEKKFYNGYIHYRMKDYSGALMYLREISELGNTDRLDKLALYYEALIFRHQGLDTDAKESFVKLQQKYPGARETAKLRKHFK